MWQGKEWCQGACSQLFGKCCYSCHDPDPADMDQQCSYALDLGNARFVLIVLPISPPPFAPSSLDCMTGCGGAEGCVQASACMMSLRHVSFCIDMHPFMLVQ